MSTVIDIQKADDPRDVIHQAVQLLARGELVAFPTETVYVVGASSLNAAGVDKLRSLFNGHGNPPYAMAIKGAQEALDYVPGMSLLGRKFARRCWPGPVTIGFDISGEEGLLTSLPPETRAAVVPAGEIRLRVPAHHVVGSVLKLMPAPLLISAEKFDGSPLAAAASEVDARFGDRVTLIIDDGTCRYAQASTIVQVRDAGWSLVEPGVVTETTLTRLASEFYLFVCTGNTCRSPMAEAMFRKLMAEKLHCKEGELADRGFVAASAGLSAPVGAPASAEAAELLEERGIDLRGHESQPLTNRLLDQADHVYTMTRDHRDAILAERPELSNRVCLLSAVGVDLSDPIGGGMPEYRQCEREIEQNIRALVNQIEVN